jgi:polar amino acid transport system substrate-binding protein
MQTKLSIALLGFLLALSCPSLAKAETVMEKAARTGYLNAGFYFDTIPYSYVDSNQQLVGYSVDTIDLVKAALEKEIGKPVELLTEPIEIANETGASDVISKIESRDIDIACNIGFTWERARFVDFSVSNSISGLKLLVKQDSNLGTPDSLAGKRIAVAPDSPAEEIIQRLQPQAMVVKNFRHVKDAIAALNQGQVDAIAGDQLILDGTRQAQTNPDGYKLVPDAPYARYGVACAVPQNDSSFLGLVNRTIIGMMQGYLMGENQSVSMINRWFGPDGLTPVAPDLIKSFFRFQIQTHAQVPLAQEPMQNNTQP